jgi:hypothetical protein
MRYISGFNESIFFKDENIEEIFQRVLKDRIVISDDFKKIGTNNKYYIGEFEGYAIFIYDGNTIVEELIFKSSKVKLCLKLIDENTVISKIEHYINIKELSISEIEKDILEKENIIQKIKHGGHE